MAAKGIGEDRRELATELAARCAPLLSAQDWEHVRSALGEMHDQLAEDLPDEAEFAEVFGEFVARLIDQLGNPDVASWDQAYIYSRSANGVHRECAAAWIERRQH
jgi:hypothetical protein